LTPDAPTVVKALLQYELGTVADSTELASRAAEQLSLLAARISRLVGALGVQSMFSRAIYLARTSRSGAALDLQGDSIDALRTALGRQSPDTIVIEVAAILDELIRLLERFIGGSLVTSLLHETWPETFPSPKESP
jgi:hypothetical protein